MDEAYNGNRHPIVMGVTKYDGKRLAIVTGITQYDER
jgi:hypothetical protein